MTKVDVEKALKAFIDTVTEELKNLIFLIVVLVKERQTMVTYGNMYHN